MGLAYDLQELWDLIATVPYGHCCSYGDLGKALTHPATGRMVGRWMVNCPAEVPWWRVIAASGALPLYNRDAFLGADQRSRLADEGVPFKGELVDLAACRWTP